MKSKVFIIRILILGCFHTKASHMVGGMISVHQYAYNDSISWLPDTVNGFAVNVNSDYTTGFELQQY